jgi:hypothetical protein
MVLSQVHQHHFISPIRETSVSPPVYVAVVELVLSDPENAIDEVYPLKRRLEIP